jgi:hypothetical protein
MANNLSMGSNLKRMAGWCDGPFRGRFVKTNNLSMHSILISYCSRMAAVSADENNQVFQDALRSFACDLNEFRRPEIIE